MPGEGTRRSHHSYLYFVSAATLIWIFGGHYAHAVTRSCSRVDTPGFSVNIRLVGNIYLAVSAPTLQNCVRSCLHQQRCVSVNYIASLGQCELNDANATSSNSPALRTTDGYNYIDVQSFPQMLVGGCIRQPCGLEAICTETNTGFDCTQAVFCYSASNYYTGTLNVTRTGRTCQRWDERYPHNPQVFPAGLSRGDPGLTDHVNYCRTDRSDFPWCYTTDPNMRWEACSVPLC